MEESEAILTLKDGNTNTSCYSGTICCTCTCVLAYFLKASQRLHEVGVTTSVLQMKKRADKGSLGNLPKAAELAHKTGCIPQSMGSLHHTIQPQVQIPQGEGRQVRETSLAQGSEWA